MEIHIPQVLIHFIDAFDMAMVLQIFSYDKQQLIARTTG